MHHIFDGTQEAFVAGTYRTVEPAETLRRVQPLLRLAGITRVANVTGMDSVGIPTVIVTRPNSRSLSVSQGKGADLLSAKVSGIMESIEQWHAERVDRPLLLASLADLAGRLRVVDVNRLPQFVEPYLPTDRILWIEGLEVESGETTWLPYEVVHLDLTLPLPEGSGRFMIGSNGLASGNQPLEALAHGMCEVIERDATTLFYSLPWHLQWRRRVDPGSVDDPTCRELLHAFERAEVDVAVWDTTSDVGVPSFLCSVLDRLSSSFRPVGLARGAGCNPLPAVALARALTEAAQSRLTRIVGTRDDIQREDFEALQSEAKHELHRAQMATPEVPPLRFGDHAPPPGGTLHAHVTWMCERLRAVGVGPAIAVDLSRPELPVSVVRTIVPGLEALSEVRGYRPGERALRLLAEVQR
jgi:YcaO-like protein with predicted kinase domain